MRSAYLLGHPVHHSISPAIHNAAFLACGLDVRYELRDVAPDSLPVEIARLRQEAVVGANLTLPHKESVLALVDEIDDLARLVGAANTIHNRAGRLWATNTDVLGFARSLDEAGLDVTSAKVLLLGAGGAARAVAQAILAAGARQLVIANRRGERAGRLAGELATRFRSATLEARQLGRHDADAHSQSRPEHSGVLQPNDLEDCRVVVNTTTVGLGADETPLPVQLLPPGSSVIDIIYHPAETRLLREARQAGHPTLNGLAMLVHQAAVAWELWTGHKAPIETMRAAAESALRERE